MGNNFHKVALNYLTKHEAERLVSRARKTSAANTYSLTFQAVEMPGEVIPMRDGTTYPESLPAYSLVASGPTENLTTLAWGVCLGLNES